MRLFFETSRQANSFLCMVPVGLALALCLDFGAIVGKMRPLLDILVMLLAGLAVLWSVILFGEHDLRLYHLLGILIGAVLYTQGAGKIIRLARRKQDLRKQVKNEYTPHRKG